MSSAVIAISLPHPAPPSGERWAALALSLALHAAVLSLLSLTPPTTPPERLIKVSLVSPPAQPKSPDLPVQAPREQIVSPPDTPERAPLVETPLRSDRDAAAEREQVKRGELSKRAPVVKPAQPVKKAAAPPAPREKSASPAIPEKPAPRQLRLDSSEIASLQIPGDPKRSAAKRSGVDPARAEAIRDYKPFSSQSLEKLFSLRPGTPDYLPRLPDGEITMLNTKADRFAVFVRRVATQVFGTLRGLHWQGLPFSEVRRIDSTGAVEAVLSPEGKLLSVELVRSSGSSVFDRIILSAVEKSATDQNPPAGARAADGNIHFIFESRTWSRAGPPGQPEQRWLLLGTGLL